jgi:hypothetical protein
MSSPIDKSLMMFPVGLALYMERDGKRLRGITLRQESSPDYREDFWKQIGWTRGFWPVFDITSDDSRLSRTGIVYRHLDNYFNRHFLGKCLRENPSILTCLRVADGQHAGASLSDLISFGPAECALAGSHYQCCDTSNSSASNSSASNSSASASASASAPTPRPYTYVLNDKLDSAESEAASRKFMHGLDVYVQMSRSQPQQGGITLLQTPEGIRFRQSTHNGLNQLISTATQLIIHYKRTLCDAPFNFHPFYYIFVERGHNANLSLADILNMEGVKYTAPFHIEFSIERTGKLDETGAYHLACWPAIPTEAVATATAEETATAVSPEETATAVSPEEVLDRLRLKYTVLAEEHRTLLLIEAQLKVNEQLKDEIAVKRKILENPECQ